MIKVVKNKKCLHLGCNTIPVYGNSETGPTHCLTHKAAEMIDVVNKRCQFPGCESHPIFNTPGKKRAFCGEHKTEDMVNVVNRKCQHPECNKRASFGMLGGKRTHCVRHKTKLMILLSKKTCKTLDCGVQACFGEPAGNATHCAKHKEETMVDLINRRCQHGGCRKSPNYGEPGGTIVSCATHKGETMINLTKKRCEKSGCFTAPSFGTEPGKPLRCSKHKLPSMMNVVDKKCCIPECKTRPSFGEPGGNATHCAAHKQETMIDVKSKRCEHSGCAATQPRFGIPGTRPTHCLKHKAPGMITKPNSKCSDCKNPAIWGINRTPRHCDTHKTSDDENITERPCISCGLLYVLNKDDKCEFCDPVSFQTVRLAKQNALMDYLDARDLAGDSTDKIVDGGSCGRERPDRVYDLGDKIVVLECDEYQHDDRQCVCEQTRMVNIGQSFGGLPVYFIRFNPDDYEPDNPRKKQEDIKNRHKLVGDVISDIKNNRIELPPALVSAIYLYYDGWSSLGDETWKVLTTFATPSP